MADAQARDFQNRIRKVNKAHHDLTKGHIELVEYDGLLVPKTKSHKRRRFPLLGLALALIGFLAFKGFLHSQVGDATYQERISILESGSSIEQVGAWLMKAGPMTLWVSDLFSGNF